MGVYGVSVAWLKYVQIGGIASAATLCGAFAIERPETPDTLNDIALKKAVVIDHKDGSFSLMMVLVNNGAKPILIIFSPWETAVRGNFVICRDGKPVGGTMYSPLVNPPYVPLKPNQTTDAGGVTFKGFNPGHYDMVGLVYARIDRPDGSLLRIPLAIPRVSFDLRGP